MNGADGGDGAPERRNAASRSIERDADLDTAGRDAEFVCHRLAMALDDLVERWLNLPDRFVVFGARCTVAHFHLQGLLEIGEVLFRRAAFSRFPRPESGSADASAPGELGSGKARAAARGPYRDWQLVRRRPVDRLADQPWNGPEPRFLDDGFGYGL
ncbi:MAG: hypothetical protein ABJI59_24985, partial [Nisaea sp.]|uniref:hypothetical protein n=1 Tax=Nisaea sp. TaxID=2024842 RepID=UPI00329739C6